MARRRRRARQQPPARRLRPRLVSALVLIVAAVAVLLVGLRPETDLQDVSDDGDASAAIAAAELRWMPRDKSTRWTCIVIHHSASEAGGADRFDDWHRRKGWDELGYHFVVGNGSDTADGEVEVGSRWVAQKHGAHCKTEDDYFNKHGIGICLVGNFDRHPPAAGQLQSLRRLVTFLCREFGISPDKVLTHGGVTRQTHCPGKHFDLPAFRKSLTARAH